MSKIKVSIILPSYNVAPYIRQCVESVIGQTLRDIEILCIDAGSTDGTWEILEKISKKDERIRLIRSEVKSYGYQMNLGIREAEGEYIGIVETDDYVEPDMFQILYESAISYGKAGEALGKNERGLQAKNSLDVVKGLYIEVYEDESGNRLDVPVEYVHPDYRDGEIIPLDADPWPHFFEGAIWSGIYKKSFLTDNNIWFTESAGAAYQDISFSQLVLNSLDRIAYVRKHLYHYRVIRPGSSTWNDRVILYFKTEYERLFENENIKPGRLPYLCAKMMAAFLFEYEKVLAYAGYDSSALVHKDELEWLKKKIRDVAIPQTLFSKRLLPDYVYEKIRLFLEDEEGYAARLKASHGLLRAWISNFEKMTEGKKVVIFGSGSYGTVITRFLIRNGIIPETIIDNSESRHGQKLCGIGIRSPKEVVQGYPDAVYIIANKKSPGEMATQLASLGVSVDNIVRVEPAELWKEMREFPVLI